MGEMTPFSTGDNARERILALRLELEKLFYERDELISIDCENIKMQYMLIFGGLEYKLYEAYCDYLRLRRKKEMIQAKKNREEPIDLEEIEAALDVEFRAYKERLQAKMEEVTSAIDRSEGEWLSEEDTVRLKQRYRRIMKRLHPDLNPSVTEEERELFYRAVESYKNGDLATIEMILALIEGRAPDDLPTDAAAMEEEIARLEALIKSVREQIENIKEKPPYIWKIYVEDGKKRAAKLRDLRAELWSYKDGIRTQEESIAELLRNDP